MPSVKERFLALLKSNNTPQEIALGTAIGVFIGVMPLYGFHTLLFILAAFLVKRANKVAILIGTNISLPPTVPFITMAGYDIGRWMMPGRYPALDLAVLKHLTFNEIAHLFVPLFAGSFVLGLALALFFYMAVYFMIKACRKRTPKARVFFICAALTAFIFMLWGGILTAGELSKEKLIYDVSPVGKSTYDDFGRAKLDGRDVRLATFRTQAMGFDDTEKIYSDPETSLPIRVERDITLWLKKEYIVEEYDQKNFKLTIKKYNGKKVIQTLVFDEKGPIYNAVLLPFSLRREKNMGIGWKKIIRIPATFEVKLSSIDEITVAAGKFKAYHFTSSPNKFEIWITCDEARVPVKIKGTGGLGYAMEMRSREAR